MVVFCVGDTLCKRADFRKEEKGKLSLDNDEVLGVVKSKGKTYFAVGAIPFGNMTVSEFVIYSKSLSKEVTKESEIRHYKRLFGFSLPLKRKLKRLSVPKYRSAQFLARFTPSISKIYINFDGLEYSKRNNADIKNLLKVVGKNYQVFVAVSDYRFIPTNAVVRKYESDGLIVELCQSSFVCNKTNKKALLSIGRERDDMQKLKPKKVTYATG